MEIAGRFLFVIVTFSAVEWSDSYRFLAHALFFACQNVIPIFTRRSDSKDAFQIIWDSMQ